MNTPRLFIKLKILFTIFFLTLPLLFFPEAVFQFMGFPVFNNIIFVRLLGVAYFALSLMYIFLVRLPELKNPVWQLLYLSGAVSNGAALIVLALFYQYITALNSFGQIYFIITTIFLIAFTVNFLRLIIKNTSTTEPQKTPRLNQVIKLQPKGRWYIPFSDTNKWKTGIYRSEYKSSDEIPEFEKHTAAELFLAQNGRCGLLLYDEIKGEKKVILKQGEAILVDGWHNGFQVDEDAYFFVVEADGLDTSFLQRKSYENQSKENK